MFQTQPQLLSLDDQRLSPDRKRRCMLTQKRDLSMDALNDTASMLPRHAAKDSLAPASTICWALIVLHNSENSFTAPAKCNLSEADD